MPSNKVASGMLVGGNVIVSDQKEANSLNQKGYFGEIGKGGKLTIPLVEALYLVENTKLRVSKGKKVMDFDTLLAYAEERDAGAFVQYLAFSDIRDRGYIVKSGFKFGAHFRIYERGRVPGEDHAKYLIHALPENFSMTLTEFSRLVRLGHSVKKELWIAVVDNDSGVTYYTLGRVKP
jgi:tRNA-intron endonuclease